MIGGKRQVLLACLAILTPLAGCGTGGEQPSQPATSPAPVQAMTIAGQPIHETVVLPGRIQAVRTAEVRARTDGLVLRRLYTEGSDIVAGQPLFEIDARDLRAQADQARAALARSEAARDNASQVLRRYAPLLADRAISAQELDQASATKRQEEANVAEARAAVSRARLALSFTTIRAPISGRVGRAQVTEGALVSASGATLMTTIDQVTPIHAVFTESSAAILDLMQAVQAGHVELGKRIQARLILPNGKDYGQTGTLDFASQSVDPATGSQTLRAVFRIPCGC